MGVVRTFFLSSVNSLFILPLFGLQYRLKGPLNPKQPTNVDIKKDFNLKKSKANIFLHRNLKKASILKMHLGRKIL